MAKGFLDDTFEKIVEAGGSTIKAIPGAVVKSFIPLQPVLEYGAKPTTQPGQKEHQKMQEQMEKPKSTPLDFGMLEQKYAAKDGPEMAAARNTLFHKVKKDEADAIEFFRRREEERKRKYEQEAYDKKRKEDEALQQRSVSAEPQGKHKQKLGEAAKKASTDMPTAETRGNKSSK